MKQAPSGLSKEAMELWRSMLKTYPAIERQEELLVYLRNGCLAVDRLRAAERHSNNTVATEFTE